VWDRGVPIWRATRAAIKAGFRPKRVNLKFFANDEAALHARCHRLVAEQNEWLSGIRDRQPVFDGTIGAVVKFWQADPDSPYRSCEASSQHPYNIYARMIIETVGTRRVGKVDGRDLRRWHAKWSESEGEGRKPMFAKARMAMIVLKNALTFAASCRWPGCGELRDILGKMRLRGPRPRSEAPTAAEIILARKAAYELGHPSAAFAYALQFEGSIRQWDVIGKWVPLSDKKASAIIHGTSKWVGPMWSQIDEHLILRYTPAKTQFTTGAEVVLDLRELPMVMEEFAKVPPEARQGPLVVNGRTGLPYRNWYYGNLWRKVRKLTGLRKEVWNRDMRAAAVSEAREAANPATLSNMLDDVSKVAGHSSKRSTAVYDRARLEAARRVAKARVAHRGRTDGDRGVS
jgi:hypothetical protein